MSTRSNSRSSSRSNSQRSTGRVVAAWAGRHTWAGVRWASRRTARHATGAATRTGRRVATPMVSWTRRTARYGLAATAQCGDCGERFPLSRQHDHPCFHQAPPDRTGGFSGQRVRADEPDRASKLRAQQDAFATRATWSTQPRVASLSEKQLSAEAAEHRRRRTDDAIEQRLWAELGQDPPDPHTVQAWLDGRDPRTTHPSGTGPVSAPSGKELAMIDPSKWAENASAFTDHGISSTSELVQFLEAAPSGAAHLSDHLAGFAQQMRAASVDDKICQALDEASDAAQEISVKLRTAHTRADQVYGDVEMPDFSKTA